MARTLQDDLRIIDNVLGRVLRRVLGAGFADEFESLRAFARTDPAVDEHHPNWENVYNQLTVKLNTHDVEGITPLDIDLATAIESIIG
ncbi:MAG: 4a-hydroxytetrahydrobiopterin dehydratase [Planctomycetota bacterium]